MMASMKLIVCCAALAVLAIVAAHPPHCKKDKPKPPPPPPAPKPCPKHHPKHHPKPPHHKPNHHHKHKCPDTWIERFFIEIDVTIGTDYDWIARQIEFLKVKSDVTEYTAIIDLYGQLQVQRTSFDTYYEGIYSDIFGRVTDYRTKYSPLSIYYTERIVSTRKIARRQLFPELCKFRTTYFQLTVLIDQFYDKYSIQHQPRALVLPRPSEYNFDLYFPVSPRSKDLSLLYQNYFNDYRLIVDIIERINFPDNHPLYPRRKKFYDEIIDIWVDFDNYRRGIDSKYYPRFLDCWENVDQVDVIYVEIINNLRPYQIKFGNRWYDIYVQLQDLCNEANIEFIDYIEWDNWTPQTHLRGNYLPSPLLSKYFNNVLVTVGMDYSSALRLWNELDLKPNGPNWNRRVESLNDLKKYLRDIERIVNKLIRDTIRRINTDYINSLDNFDVAQRTYIDEVILNCNNELWPHLLQFRERYYYNDQVLYPILKERNLVDIVTRAIIPTQTYGYNLAVYCYDQEIRDLINWFEGCFRTNYYGPVTDLIQVRFDEGCDEYNLRRKSLKDLELIWLDYRKLINELFRDKFIDLIVKRKVKIGCDEYTREVRVIVDWLRPSLNDLLNRFKGCCCEINGILDRLYSKSVTKVSRSYTYVETSFEIKITSSVKVC